MAAELSTPKPKHGLLAIRIERERNMTALFLTTPSSRILTRSASKNTTG